MTPPNPPHPQRHGAPRSLHHSAPARHQPFEDQDPTEELDVDPEGDSYPPVRARKHRLPPRVAGPDAIDWMDEDSDEPFDPDSDFRRHGTPDGF